VLAAPSAFAQPSEGPPGYAQGAPVAPPEATNVTFVSSTEKRWDVRLDDSAVCTTPCAIAVPPLHFVTLHSHDIRPTKLSVGYLPRGDVLVSAKPRDDGPFAAGVTFTSLGGMALVTGITLTAVGYGTDNGAMRTAGLITGVAGAAVTAGGIQLIRKALPTVHVGPGRAQPYVTAGQVGLAGSF
jgi:hypothetical protein